MASGQCNKPSDETKHSSSSYIDASSSDSDNESDSSPPPAHNPPKKKARISNSRDSLPPLCALAYAPESISKDLKTSSSLVDIPLQLCGNSILDSIPLLFGNNNNIPLIGNNSNIPAVFRNKNNENEPEEVDPSITLASIGGLEEQVSYIRKNILYPMEHMNDFEAWGIEPMKGVIFHGPPGTGKTILAKALVSELSKNGKKVNFFMKKGTDCFSKYIGDTEKSIRNLFQKATLMKPSIIFLDELDGLCSSRNSENHMFYTSVVTTLLGQIDSIKRGEVFLIGATNRLDSIDPAIKRPGRFDKTLEFLPPNETGRKQILNIFLNKWKSNKPSQKVVDDLSRRTVGFTGADLEQLCRETFNCAMDRQLPSIGKPGSDGENENNIKYLKITDDDWNTALSKMGRSNSNVFGNSVYTGEMIDPIIQPLINGIISEINCNVKKFLHTHASISDPTCKGAGIKSFLIWDETIATVDVVNTLIFPSIMASFDVEKTPGFIISEMTLQKIPMTTALEQVHSCRKTCFLFIPRIDKLWAKQVQHCKEDIFRESMENTRTTDIILIASSACDLHMFPEGLRSIFRGIGRSYKMRKPNEKERHEFFSSIFDPRSNYMQNILKNCSKCANGILDKLEELSIQAEKLTENDEIKTAFALHGELARVCVKFSIGDKVIDPLLKEFDEVMEEYKNNKFDH